MASKKVSGPAKRRTAGEGGIDRLASGKWRARYRGPDGRRHTDTFAAKADASAWLADQRVKVSQGGWVEPRAGQISLAKYARQWLESRTDLRPTTRSKYSYLLERHILLSLGGTDIGRLTASTVRGWYLGLQLHHAATADDAYRLLRAILNTAISDQLILKSPCQVKGAGQVRSPERPTSTVAELTTAVESVPERYQLAFMLCAWCHLRRGEVLALQRRDLDLLHGTVQVERALVVPMGGAAILGPPKTKAGKRTIHFPDNLKSVIAAHLEQHVGPDPEAWLFGTKNGASLSPRNLQRVWDRARRAAGRPDLRIHDLRHSGLTWAAATGASTKELMRRGGQTSPRAALIYQHATEDRDRVIAEALAELASPPQVAPLRRRDEVC